MDGRAAIFLTYVLHALWVLVCLRIERYQRRRPLPPQIAPAHTRRQVGCFRSYHDEQDPFQVAYLCLSLAFRAAVLWPPVFAWIERLTTSPFLAAAIGWLVLYLPCRLLESLFEAYLTFVVDRRYELLSTTSATWLSAQAREMLEDLLTIGVRLYVFVMAMRLLESQVMGGDPADRLALLTVAAGAAALLSLASLAFFLRTYHFEPLPPSRLRDRATRMLATCRKHVDGPYIYDASRYSRDSNAFALDLPLVRRICLADNLVRESSEREVLATLAHEMGHINYRRHTLLWALALLPLDLLWIVPICMLLRDPILFGCLLDWFRQPFGLAAPNLCLVRVIYLFVNGLATLPSRLVLHCRQQARRASLRCGDAPVGPGAGVCGRSAQRLCERPLRHEPLPILVFLEHDHPSPAQRVSALSRQMAQDEEGDQALHNNRAAQPPKQERGRRINARPRVRQASRPRHAAPYAARASPRASLVVCAWARVHVKEQPRHAERNTSQVVGRIHEGDPGGGAFLAELGVFQPRWSRPTP